MSQVPRTFFTSFANLGRHWYKRSIPQHIENSRATNFEFTVASYNILADQLMKDNPFLYTEGKSRDPDVFDWNYRKHNLLREIQCADADVLCLQEVQEEHYYDWFNPRLREHGYTGVYKRRTGDKWVSVDDGCATFFKTNKFTLLSDHKVEYYRENVKQMDRSNVAIILFLKPRRQQRVDSTICIANTHLLFNKSRGDIKLTQLAHLFADMNLHSQEYRARKLSTVVCGDFNSHPYSPLYNLITKRELRYEGLSRDLISGQNKYTVKYSKKFGAVIFRSDTGLANNCEWVNCDHLKHKKTANRFPNEYSNKYMGKRYMSPHMSLHSFKDPCVVMNNALTHNLSLKSCHGHPQRVHPHRAHGITTMNKDEAETVDYIFYGNGGLGLPDERHVEKDNLFLSGVLGLLSEHDLDYMGRLPNKYLSSDHVLTQASFILQSAI